MKKLARRKTEFRFENCKKGPTHFAHATVPFSPGHVLMSHATGTTDSFGISTLPQNSYPCTFFLYPSSQNDGVRARNRPQVRSGFSGSTVPRVPFAANFPRNTNVTPETTSANRVDPFSRHRPIRTLEPQRTRESAAAARARRSVVPGRKARTSRDTTPDHGPTTNLTLGSFTNSANSANRLQGLKSHCRFQQIVRVGDSGHSVPRGPFQAAPSPI